MNRIPSAKVTRSLKSPTYTTSDDKYPFNDPEPYLMLKLLPLYTYVAESFALYFVCDPQLLQLVDGTHRFELLLCLFYDFGLLKSMKS